MTKIFDIAIIGAGAVGSAIARELARYNIGIALLEAAPDVGMGTSKASTAIYHTGFDAKPGSLEATLMRRSYPLMESFMRKTGAPFERIGGLLIAWNDEQKETLPKLLEKANQNGVTDCYLIDRDEVYKREPHLGAGALGGMFVPGEGILCTYTIPLACATQAVVNGVELKVNFPVEKIVRENDVHIISGAGGTVSARWVVNAAGLYSDEINAYFGLTNFKVTPRRGELIVYDKLARPLVNHVLLPVPTSITKGVLISPTIYGNILLGPTAEDLPDKTATSTSQAGLQMLIEKGKVILPELVNEEVTATYAGLRAATEHSDYQIALHADKKYVCVGGIRSTGISACLGIAEYVAELLKEGGVALTPKPDFKNIKMPNIGETFMRPYQSADMITANPDYGQVVCHCERVTLGELQDAMHATIPAQSLDALRRRTRAIQGRCQGFNCQAALLKTLESGSLLPKSRQLAIGLQNHSDVLIIGAGPAGLSAALELNKLGIKDVVVVDRESEAGGMPRMCDHTGFGLRDLQRILTGPAYARQYRERAERAGIAVHTSTTINDWQNKNQVSYTNPHGLGNIEARAILLATGVRERPRAARLIPGTRPQGVFTTGSLQRFVYEQHLPVGKRAVIVGAETVSLSVVLTLMHAGVQVLNLLTNLPSHQLYFPFLPAKWLFADLLAHAPIIPNVRVTQIFGRKRVEGIQLTHLDSGRVDTLDCDTVVFTGDWIPENEIARKAHLDINPASHGPRTDSAFRTSQPGIFAAGNLLRGVETADWAALEGRQAAHSIQRYLQTGQWPARSLTIQVEHPLAWIFPNTIAPDALPSCFRIRSNEFRKNVCLQLKQGERVLSTQKFAHLTANTSLNFSSDWVSQVDLEGEPVKLAVTP